MERKLKIFYARCLGFIIGVWAVCRVVLHFDKGPVRPAEIHGGWGTTLFILTAVCALGGPIVYRTLFAHIWRNKPRVERTAFFIFERNLILIGMAALLSAMAADILAAPSFHRTGAFLMALYANYCGFPSSKRLTLDRRLFRVTAKAKTQPALRLVRTSSESRLDVKDG